MDILKELVYVVDHNKLKALKMKDLYLDQQSKISQLYELISQGKVHSDDEAFTLLYPDVDDNGAFRFLKTTLKTRLHNYLFFIDLKTKSFSDRQRAFLDCNKKWAMINLLIGRGARKSAVDLALRVIRKAIKFEFIEIVVDLSKLLKYHYGGIERNKKAYQKYKSIYQKYLEYYLKENEIEEVYTDFVLEFYSDKKNNNTESSSASKLIFDRIKYFQPLTGSYKLQLYFFLIKIMAHELLDENQAIITACREAERIFGSKKYEANTALQIFYYQQLVAFTQLKQFKEGSIVAEKCLSLLEPGTINWFRYNESYFILAMHTDQYEEACKIYSRVVRNKRFQATDSNTKEMWKIFQAYLYMIMKMSKVPSGICQDVVGLKKFRIGKFLNEMPTYSKEKQGMNISILIIQILHYTRQRNYDAVIDSIEAIEKYCTRYLKTQSTIRSYYFIKMILTVPAQGFYKPLIEKKARKYFAKLQETSTAASSQNHGVEIIPYEKLWGYVLEMINIDLTKSD